MDLAAELQRIYDSEINAEITWFWDGGFTVRLGDKMNGLRLPGRGRRELGGRYFTLLQEAIAHFYGVPGIRRRDHCAFKASIRFALLEPSLQTLPVMCLAFYDCKLRGTVCIQETPKSRVK
jgi:hypothetical protein